MNNCPVVAHLKRTGRVIDRPGIGSPTLVRQGNTKDIPCAHYPNCIIPRIEGQIERDEYEYNPNHDIETDFSRCIDPNRLK